MLIAITAPVVIMKLKPLIICFFHYMNSVTFWDELEDWLSTKILLPSPTTY